MSYSQVADAVDRLLSPAQQEAFKACRAPGSMPVREFARVTDRSPGTVGNHLRRADDKLTEALGEFSLPLDFLTERDDQTGSWNRAAPLDDATELESLNHFGWRVELPDGDPHLTAIGKERGAYVGWCDCDGFRYRDPETSPCAHLCTLRQADFIDATDVDDERIRIPSTDADADRAVTDGGEIVEYAAGEDGRVFGRPEGRV